MTVYVWTDELKNAYIWIPNPTSIVLDKSAISLTTVWQTEQLTATIEPTVSDKTITWTTSDSTVATVVNGLVTCVTPWTATITATTVNGLTASCGVSAWGLPAEYQEVEYIESSWTQYIAPWLYIQAWEKFKIDMDFYRYSWQGMMFGQYTSWNPSQIGIFSSSFFCRFYQEQDSSQWTWTPSSYSNNTRFNVVFEWVEPTTQTRAALLFAQQARSVEWYSTAKLYSCRMWIDDTLVRDFVPCYRKLDGVIWLYDLVNNVFYTNQWSWTFTKWGNV